MVEFDENTDGKLDEIKNFLKNIIRSHFRGDCDVYGVFLIFTGRFEDFVDRCYQRIDGVIAFMTFLNSLSHVVHIHGENHKCQI